MESCCARCTSLQRNIMVTTWLDSINKCTFIVLKSLFDSGLHTWNGMFESYFLLTFSNGHVLISKGLGKAFNMFQHGNLHGRMFIGQDSFLKLCGHALMCLSERWCALGRSPRTRNNHMWAIKLRPVTSLMDQVVWITPLLLSRAQLFDKKAQFQNALA